MPNKDNVTARLLLAVVLLVSASVRFYRASDPIGGFHGFNEANYVLIAQNFKQGGWLRPTPDGSYVFRETPPLYPYLIYFAQSFFASPIAAARALSALASLGAILLVFALGRLLFGPSAGVLASALFAFAPVNAILGHNAQTDSLYLCLLLLAQWLYLKASMTSGSPKSKKLIASGAALGAAGFAKAFAWISLPPWFLSETWRHGGLGWIKNRALWIAVGVALLIPLPFYLYQAGSDIGGLITDTLYGALLATGPGSFFGELLEEAWWGYSPLIGVLLAIGFIWGCLRRDWTHRFLLLQASAYLAFLVFVHKHSYYIAGVTPFLALLSGDALSHLRPRLLAKTTAVAASAFGLFLSVSTLCQVKYGFDEFAQLKQIYDRVYNRSTILIRADMEGSYKRELQYYLGPQNLINLDAEPVGPDHQIQLKGQNDRVFIHFIPPDAKLNADFIVNRKCMALVLFGIEIREEHPNYHFFTVGPFSFSKRYDWTTFGIFEAERRQSLALVRIPGALHVFKEPGRLVFKESP